MKNPTTPGICHQLDEPDLITKWRHLWPHPDNQRVIRETLGALLDDYYHWHARWQPSSTAASPADDSLVHRSVILLRELSQRLQVDSMPWPASGYLAQINTDVLLPAELAYFAAMLYNPNNVTPEASPVTTALEYELSDDFCSLFGFDPEHGWAHLTSGGHAANYEGMWIARNLKCIPLAIAEMPELAGLLEDNDLDRLCNLPPACIAQLLTQAAEQGQLDALLAHARTLRLHPSLAAGRILVAHGRHYAWDKCADLLGLTLEPIDVDASMRIDVEHLRRRLFAHLQAAHPIVAVVATVGSSGEGSVDEIHRIVALRQECEQRFGASFFLHADAASGGYYRSLLLSPTKGDDTSFASTISDQSAKLKPEVAEALRALNCVDTVTVDPHKCGYVPYPAGCLAMRERRFSWVIGSQIKYFGQAQCGHMDFGPYTLEGTRPGAAAAAVWTAHRLLGLNRDGYGALLSGNLCTASRLHHALNALPPLSIDGYTHRFQSIYGPDLSIINFCVRPIERVGSVEQRITLLSERIIGSPQQRHARTENMPWFSRNRMALQQIMPDDNHSTCETTVVRCCVMKPVTNGQFPEFWHNNLKKILERVKGK
ncbi:MULTISPECIES: pyridoxal-dependent decarboxylase [Burkholderiaceae]|uniref:pyridoxal phosphate-dependent decarboxylase family protein n=1 Tax=Burkholderiaceae TaxID=119060 RepID=UPI000966CC08|nr:MULTISPECIES: pyridoxal-dependent decarboxylase [Burkholderiaceae]MCG1019792.1 hypothetical protein [Mycetohabitans sp. B4]SIT80025.1 Glutamate or tyrosine decarboxylase [Burkholderia sp. b13]